MGKLRPVSRRTLLRGAGAALALPWLDAMVPAFAATEAVKKTVPLRLGIYSVAGGVVLESWKPAKAGDLDGPLPSILRPLEAHRRDLLLLSGLAHHGGGRNVNAHEHAAYLHLTGSPMADKVNGAPRTTISIDQKVARHIGDQTYLPSLEIATTPSHEQRYSFRSATELMPYEIEPRIILERLFRGRAPMAPNWAKRSAALAAAQQSAAPRSDSLDQSVLDLVREDARSLQTKVGTADRRRLEQYLESVRSIERRTALLEARAKAMMEDGAGIPVDLPPGLPADAREWEPIQQASNQDPEMQQRYIDLLGDLMILALQTDTTRVCTFAVGDDGSLFPGVVTVGFERHFHTLEHQGGNPDPRRTDPIAREACRQISEWFVGNFARFVGRMKAIDEGEGTLLDNTMLLFTSYMADGGHHRSDFPVMFVGGAQGTLKTGRHVAYPHGTPMSNLFVEMLDRMQVRVAEFGESRTSPAAAFDGRLPGLV